MRFVSENLIVFILLFPTVMPVFGFLIGASLVQAIGYTASTLVPMAMSFFGAIVPGVGTIHAAAADYGVAAVLQATAATCTGAVATVIGGAFGALVQLAKSS